MFTAEQGLGDYTDAAAARTGGVLLIAVNLACLALAIGFSVPRLRAGRVACWVPLVCAAIAFVLTVVVSVAAVLADPAVAARVLRAG